MNSESEKRHFTLNQSNENPESVSDQAMANIDPVDKISEAIDTLRKEELEFTDSLQQKEYPEPVMGSAPFSSGLIILGLVCMFLGGFYLEKRSAGYDPGYFSESSPGDQSVLVAQGSSSVEEATNTSDKGAAEPAVDVQAMVSAGKTVYETYCLACHQANGEGLPGAFPALAGSEWVLESDGPGRLIRIVLQGLQGPIEVKGQSYNSVMVAWRSQLTDDDVANVLTYIRQEWGNDAGYVTSDQVASVWSEISSRGEEAWTSDLLMDVDPAVGSTASGESSNGSGSGAEEVAVSPATLKAGEEVYLTMCVACHQQNGQGLAGLFPPLAGSEWVNANQPDRIVRIVLHGLQGEIDVLGQTYNNVMTPWKDLLTDQQIADAISYIRNSWDNSASGVSASKVTEIRQATADRDTPWTVGELMQVSVD